MTNLNRTRLSLFYLAGYLGAGGLGMLIAPQFALNLLGATREYDPVFVRFSGMFMVGFSAVILTFIQYRLYDLYPKTLLLRVFFLACLIWFYLQTSDRLFLVLFGIVGLGMIFTGTSLILDRRGSRGELRR